MSDTRQEFAQGWRPNKGDVVSGVVTAFETRQGKFGDYPVYTLALDGGGSLGVHAYHKVLRDELEQAVVGDHVRVVYGGKAETNDGRPFHLYGVEISKDEP
jgi:hypothetical protein